MCKANHVSEKQNHFLYQSRGECESSDVTDCNTRNVNLLWEQKSLLYVNVYCFKRQDFRMLSKRGL